MTAILFSTFGTLSAIEFDCTIDETHTRTASATEHDVEEGAAISDHVKVGLPRLSLQAIITNTPLNASAVDILVASGRYKLVAPVRASQTTSTVAVPSFARQELGSSLYTNGWVSGAAVSGGMGYGLVPRIGPVAFPPQLAPKPTVIPAVREKRPVAQAMQVTTIESVDRVLETFAVLDLLMETGTQVRVLTDLKEYPVMVIESLSIPRRAEDALHFSMSLKAMRFATVKSTFIRARLTEKKQDQPPAPVAPAAVAAPTLPPEIQERVSVISAGKEKYL